MSTNLPVNYPYLFVPIYLYKIASDPGAGIGLI